MRVHVEPLMSSAAEQPTSRASLLQWRGLAQPSTGECGSVLYLFKVSGDIHFISKYPASDVSINLKNLYLD